MCRRLLLGIVLFSAVAGVLHAEDLSKVSADTLRLYDIFQKNYKNPNSSDPKLVTDLAKAPDADLCFLDCIDRHRGTYDYVYIAARDQLAKLNTQRSFDRLMAMLDSKASEDRVCALDALSAWRRPEAVTKILERLQAKEAWERRSAINTLTNYQDPRIDPTLLTLADSESDGFSARRVLAVRQYGRAYAKVVLALKDAPEGERDSAIANVAAFHRPESVELLLAEMRSFDAKKLPYDAFLRGWTDARLQELLADPMKEEELPPDSNAEQWEAFWKRTKPLVTDDLKLKNPRKPKVELTYKPEDYAENLKRVTLTASVDRKSYRVGDPILLKLELTNTGDQPAMTIVPDGPSGWMPTMGYGVLLKRGKTTLFEIEPSSQYQGSYSGPPRFRTLSPKETFAGKMLLQSWLRYDLNLPLIEGEYELEIKFDSSKFAGVQAKGVERLHRWTAPMVHFTVAGPALDDPKEMLTQIATLSGNQFLASDLASGNAYRRNAAWETVFKYGDSRVAKFLREIKFQDENASAPLDPKDLRPFTAQSHGS